MEAMALVPPPSLLNRRHNRLRRLCTNPENTKAVPNITICAIAPKSEPAQATKWSSQGHSRRSATATLVTTMCREGLLREAMGVLHGMDRGRCIPIGSDVYTALLQGCAKSKSLLEGKQIHAHIFVNGLHEDVFLGSKLVSMYAMCGCMVNARLLFDKMSKRDAFVWTAMISGFVQNELYEDALTFYYRMLKADIKPDNVTFSCVLKACAGLSSLEPGTQIHADVIRRGFESSVFVGSALVAMYAECRSMQDARQVFDKMSTRDLASWNAMIAGYGMNGHAEDALVFFHQMQQEGRKPNCMTFDAILFACSHAGLVDEGWQYFNCMSRDYNITPTAKHYDCMINLLCHARHLDEAESVIQSLPLGPRAAVCRALLVACNTHCNIELGERAAKWLFELEPQNAGNYALLSKIYAVAGRWDDVAKVKAIMKDKGMQLD